MDRVFAKLDKQGRIVLPAKYREELEINIGEKWHQETGQFGLRIKTGRG